MKPLEVAVLGAGGRGFTSYGRFALQHPHLIKYAAVAEPDDVRRRKLSDLHGIRPQFQFRTWEELIEKRPPVVAVLNCLQDSLHRDSAIATLEAGYHQLLEKPFATTPHHCLEIVRTAKRTGRTLAICHVLRYAPFFRALKELLESGVTGDIVCLAHQENVAYWHYESVSVRGPWSRTAESSPWILAKSCHDLDLIVWLASKKPKRITSFGSLSFFRPENAPPGSTDRCLDGCPAEPECAFSVQKLHLGGRADVPGWSRYHGLVGGQGSEKG